MSTKLLAADLMPVKHGEASIGVTCKRDRLGYVGVVQVNFPDHPNASYKILGDVASTTAADAVVDAIRIRRDLIDQNKVSKS